MKILAIETVGRTGSVALVEDQQVVLESVLDAQRRGAQTLAPAMAELLAKAGWSPSAIDLVAVASGPGSFTGLRIGVTTAKAFAYAAGCQVVGVPTLLAIAWRAPRDVPRFSVVLDADQRELFVGQFVRDPQGVPSESGPTRIETEQAWLASLTPGDVVTGPALARVGSLLPKDVLAIDNSLWAPSASAVGHVGRRLLAAGAASDAFSLVPWYGRRTAAEERRDG